MNYLNEIKKRDRVIELQDKKLSKVEAKCDKMSAKIDALSRLVESYLPANRIKKHNLPSDALTMTAMAHRLDTNAMALNAVLRKHGWMYFRVNPSGTKCIPTDRMVDNGYFEVRSGQPFVTKTGQVMIEKYFGGVNFYLFDTRANVVAKRNRKGV